MALLVLLLNGPDSWAQATKTLPGDYVSFTQAINDVNTTYPNGGVTVNVAAGYTETAPAGGLPLLTAQGSSTAPIVFQKVGGGPNPLITAPVGTLNPSSVASPADGIVRLSGADYVTFDGIDLLDPASNNTPTKAMEFGYAFFRPLATNGCQNNTIQNCTVTMNRSGSGSTTGFLYGVYMALTTATGSSITPTSAAGSNSGNRFYANTILNAQSGIFVTGYSDNAPYALADQNNDFGGSAAATGNTIRNYGGVAGIIAYGIRATYQQSPNASYNTVENAGGGGAATASSLYGVYLTLGSSGDITLTNNTVTLVHAPATTGVTGTAVYSGHTGTGTANLNNNVVSYTLNNGSTTASANTRFLVHSNSSTAIGALNMNGNQVTCNLGNASTGGINARAYGVYNQGPVARAASLSNNTVRYALSNSGSGGIAASGSACYGVINDGATPSMALNANTVAYSLTNTTSAGAISASCQAIYNGGSVSGTLSMSGNVISHTVPASPATVGTISGNLLGLFNPAAVPGNLVIDNNTVNYAITNGGTTISSGLTGLTNQNSGISGTTSFSGNTFNFALATSAGTTSSTLLGISNSATTPLMGAATMSNNTFTYSGTSTGGTFSSAFTGISNGAATGSTLTIDNNTLLNSNTASTGTMTFIAATGASSALVTISNNRYQNSSTASAGPVYFITNGTGTGTTTANNLLVQDNSFTNLTRTGAGTTYGYYNLGRASAAGTHTLSNNTIAGLTLMGAFAGLESLVAVGSGATIGITYSVTGNVIGRPGSGGSIASTGVGAVTGLQVGGFALSGTLANNSVQSLSGTGQVTGLTLSGDPTLPVSTTSTYFAGSISGNTIAGLRTSSATASVYGMYLPASNATSGAISTIGNRVADLSVPGMGTVYGIDVVSGPSHTLANNVIGSLTAPASTVANAVVGLYLLGGTTVSAYYNTVYLGSTGPSTSAACYRASTGTTTLRNNIFYNERTGSGSNYALANASTTGFVGSPGSPSANTSDYNLFVTADAAKVGLYGSTAYSFAGWKTATGGDGSSLSETTAVVPAASLFTDASTADLSLQAGSPLAWYANGTGTQVATISTDYAGTPRPSTVAAGAPDLGAFEVTPTSTPPALAVSAAPALGGTQAFALGGRTLATLVYGSTGTVPSSVVARYYSGTNPPAPFVAGARYANAYFDFSDANADGSGYTYQPTLTYDPALLGTIASEAAQRISQRNPDNTGYGTFFSTAVSPAPTRTLTGPGGLTGLGILAIGDEAAPLPVQLVRFEAVRQGTTAALSWATASEMNNQSFEVQVSTDGQVFRKLGFVAGAGNSQAAHNYEYLDEEAGKTGLRYYRLRQLDFSGKESFSPIRTVQFEALMGSLVAWPNPCQQAVHLGLKLPQAAASASLTLTDVMGHQVLRQELGPLPAGFSQPTLESAAFGGLPAGVYVLRLATAASAQMLKLVKE